MQEDKNVSFNGRTPETVIRSFSFVSLFLFSLLIFTKTEICKALNCRSEGSVGEREAESSLKREVDQLVDDEVKRFCQDDNNATVKGSNSVVFLVRVN